MPNPVFRELRGYFDGSDSFMTHGHQIIKPHRGKRQTPEWARNNKGIRQILLRAFPKLNEDESQRAAAARWAILIQLHFRVLMSYKQTGDQMGITPKAVECISYRIRRIANSQKIKHRGRPKNK